MTTVLLLYSIINFFKRNKAIQIKKIRFVEGNNCEILIHTMKGNISLIYNFEKEIMLPTLFKFKTIDTKIGWLNKLRQIIENCIIEDIEILEFERILKIICRKHTKKYNLIIEIFGGGNIILTDEENNILVIQKEIEVRHRKLKVNGKYLLPPARGLNPLKLDKQKLFEHIRSINDLYKVINIDKYSIREALARIGIKHIREKREIDLEYIAEKVIEKLRELIVIAEEGREGFSIVKSNEEKLEILPFNTIHTKTLKNFDNILDATTFYIENTLLKRLDWRSLKERERLSKSIKNLEINREKLLIELSILEEWIPTLYQKIDELNLLFERAKKGKLKEYDINYNKKIIIFPLTNTFFVPLKFDINPFQSIELIYNREYKKRKKAVENISEKIDILTKKLKIIESTSLEKMMVRNRRILKRRKWYEKFRWFITSGEKLVIGGRDSNTNEILIKKYLEEDDIVFHSEFYGSPFVILKKGRDSKEEEIREAAIFTASYSRAWREGIYTLDVYYVYPNQVSKKAPSGEYLKKGSFMIYGRKNFVRKIPLLLWIGIQKEGKEIFVGPSNAVKTHCLKDVLFEIKPGEKSKRELSDIIIDEITKRNLLKIDKNMRNYYINDIISKLPPGKSMIKIIMPSKEKNNL